MGSISRLARSFGFLLLVAGSAAQAEVMHMPFDCRFDGARVHLRPAPGRAYTVIGRHEREIFTACSPTDPETCRDWFVHRFEFDCDGDRVAWIEAAVAAARFSDWDAWIANGSFRMRMNRLWGVARARPLGPPRRSWRRRHYGAREDAFAGDYGPRVVSVRPGFAPAAGIALTFSGGAPDVADVPSPPGQAAPAIRGTTPDVAERTRPPVQEAPAVAAYTAESVHAPIPDLPQRAPPKAERLAAASAPPVVAPAPQPAMKPALTQETDSSLAATVPSRTQTKAGDGAAAPAKSPGFTIINGPRAAAAPPPPAAVAPPPPVAEAPPPPAAEAPPPPATVAPLPPTAEATASTTPAPIETAAVRSPAADLAEATPPDTDAATPSADATPAPPVSDTATAQSPPQPRAALPELSSETMVAAAATTLVLAGLAVFGIWLWRRRPAEHPPVNRRDIADISFDGVRAAPALALERRSATLDALASLGGEESEDANAAALPVPTTYAEALEILGASPDASTSAIKKIVDGLRQSWHPDLARSEPERLDREARVRQINVAWDLVSQRRRAA